MLEAAVERLLNVVEGVLADLDALDGDADLEPSLASLGALSASFDQTRWAVGLTADLEEQCEGGGGDDACDDEGAQCEGEGDHDEREPEEAW
jgi:hypothetical protein